MSVKEKKRIQVQIDKNLAEEADLIFNELGLSQGGADIFLAVVNSYFVFRNLFFKS